MKAFLTREKINEIILTGIASACFSLACFLVEIYSHIHEQEILISNIEKRITYSELNEKNNNLYIIEIEKKDFNQLNYSINKLDNELFKIIILKK